MLSEARPARKANYREPEGKSILLRPIIYLKNIDTSSFYSIYCQIRHHMLVVSPVGIQCFPLAVPLFLRVLFYVGENIMPDRNKRKLMQNSSDIEMEQTVSKLARYYRLDRKQGSGSESVTLRTSLLP